MVRRIFSLTLRVERDVPEDELAEWVEDAVGQFVNYHMFKIIAVTELAAHKVVYAQLRVLHYTNVDEVRIRSYLATLPQAVRLEALRRLENGDNVSVLQLRPVVIDAPA